MMAMISGPAGGFGWVRLSRSSGTRKDGEKVLVMKFAPLQQK